MNEKAKEARRAYKREWNRKNHKWLVSEVDE